MSALDSMITQGLIARVRIERASSSSVRLACCECGNTFKAKAPTLDTSCKKCGSYDLEVA
jgi:Zn finger protein HypA/HybF involved in hydrogenase expression